MAVCSPDTSSAPANYSLTSIENFELSGTINTTVLGNLSDNVLRTGNGADSLNGGAGNDTLFGRGGNDTLDGGTGSDSMAGGAGSDLYFVDDAGDVVSEADATAAGGIDRVNTTLAAYTLGANIEQGGILALGAANLTGNALNNALFAGSGDNVLNGGAGVDTVSYADASGPISANLAILVAQDTGSSGFDRFAGIENLVGSAFNDTLAGNGAANRLTGGAGDDLLNGRGGVDTLVGGLGDDTYTVDNSADVVIETVADVLTGGRDLVNSSAAAYTLSANVEDGRITTGCCGQPDR